MSDSLRALARQTGLAREGLRELSNPVDGSLTAVFRETTGQISSGSVLVVDSSSRGLRIRSNRKFEVGQNLLLTDDEEVVEVTVGHRSDGDGWHAYRLEATRRPRSLRDLRFSIPELLSTQPIS